METNVCFPCVQYIDPVSLAPLSRQISITTCITRSLNAIMAALCLASQPQSTTVNYSQPQSATHGLIWVVRPMFCMGLNIQSPVPPACDPRLWPLLHHVKFECSFFFFLGFQDASISSLGHSAKSLGTRPCTCSKL